MESYDAAVNNHSIQLSFSLWNGSEEIKHDGVVVSHKKSFGLATKHSFVAEEEGERVEYVVGMGGPIGYLIWRDGSLVAANHRPFRRYLTAVGLLAVALGILLALLYLVAFVIAEPANTVLRIILYWSSAVVFVGALPLSRWLKSHLIGKAE